MLKNKYRNKKSEYEGIIFDSKGERDRYIFLKRMESLGLIQDLKRQVTFKLFANEKLICKLIADFRYNKNNIDVVEDYKGLLTPVFRLKQKLFKANYGFDIKIVKNATEGF